MITARRGLDDANYRPYLFLTEKILLLFHLIIDLFMIPTGFCGRFSSLISIQLLTIIHTIYKCIFILNIFN